ncbi:MAG: hypothetical protein PCFJNLEI_00139 [Verrucomicrobiae bacterium]|nr:hypothetical protein [Verrucomicrobiae bacterium]
MTGIITDAVGIGLVVAGLVSDTVAVIVVGTITAGVGLFVIGEGVSGWCVLRALGVKTPL